MRHVYLISHSYGNPCVTTHIGVALTRKAADKVLAKLEKGDGPFINGMHRGADGYWYMRVKVMGGQR